MLTLRNNQHVPIDKAVEFFSQQKPQPSLIVLPTAWGKSILTACVAHRVQDKIIVLQPTKELLEQNYRKYLDLCGDSENSSSGIYSASFGRKEIAQVTYATIGSIKNLGSKFKDLGFTKIIIDEAHLYPREADSMLGRFIQDSGITHVLGITATPVKLQTYRDNDGFTISKLVMLTTQSWKGNFFTDIIHVGQVREMVELGYWSPLRYITPAFDPSLLRYNSSKSEYTEESVKEAFAANGGQKRIVKMLDTLHDRRHILVFMPSVEEARKLAARYPDSGVVWGEMDKRRRETTIERFRAGEIRVLFNVRVLSTGFDYTGIDCIVLGISTASIALYYQIIGRATRIDPNKRDALIIDLGGNVERFGRVEDISFEKGRIWRMFGTGGRLLSGIPISDIGIYTRRDTDDIDRGLGFDPISVMPFGKHKGERISRVPKSAFPNLC